MFMQMDESDPDATSINTTALSETKIIVSGSDCRDGGENGGPRGSVITQRASICGTRLASAVRQKVAAPQSAACKLFKKSAASGKYRRVPITMLQVLICGLILLIVILCCKICETWWWTAPLKKPLPDGPPSTDLGYEPHTAEDRRFHELLVNDVNSSPNSTWKAQYNKFASRANDPQIMDKESLRIALTKNIATHEWSKTQMFADTEAHLRVLSSLRNFTLPKRFDARFRWPECASVHRVVNQGGCGSCWAMAATSVMSDRVCVHSNGSRQPQISAQDLIECCRHCGGCRGTVWALFSFVHWKEHGIVTGSEYGSYDGCKPYEKAPSCGSPCSIEIYNTRREGTHDGMCWAVCQHLHDKSYHEDLHRAKNVYWVKPNVLNSVIYAKTMAQINEMLKRNDVDYETLIKRELLLNGPLVACFVVYDEFQHYKSGIYQSMTSPNTRELYGHCAKLIGWGEEPNGGLRFWTYMNTWGASWGENGFFRVVIKEVPEEAAAGIPLL